MSHTCHRFWTCCKTLTFCSLLTRCTIPCACHAKRHLNVKKCSGAEVFCTFWLGNLLRATTASTFSTSQLLKVLRSWSVLYILTWKFASRHNGVHFFDITTSKSAPKLMCFVHFDLEICFAPERRALFRHRNFEKCSGPEVFCTFWLRNVLRATTACNFSSLIWPAGSAPAALASLLFDPPEPQIIGKTQCFATFLLFCAPGSSFFWDFLFLSFFLFLFSSLTLPISAFHLSILSEVWLLNFLRLVIGGRHQFCELRNEACFCTCFSVLDAKHSTLFVSSVAVCGQGRWHVCADQLRTQKNARWGLAAWYDCYGLLETGKKTLQSRWKTFLRNIAQRVPRFL